MKKLSRYVSYVRDNRDLFFQGPDHGPTVERLLKLLLDDAITANAFPIQIDSHANWWIVAAKDDWLLDENPGTAAETFFTHVPYPKSGRHHFHKAVFITAFAEKVVTFSCGIMELINADADEVGEIEAYCKAKYSDLRVVAFVFNEEEWRNAPLKDFI
jgi:hypothetical protein